MRRGYWLAGAAALAAAVLVGGCQAPRRVAFGSGVVNPMVETDPIASTSVWDTAQIADGAVTGPKVAAGAVSNANLGADCVDGAKIADDAVDSEHYAAGSIDGEHVAAGAVGGQHLAAGAVSNAALAADAVDGAKIEDDAIDSEHYAAGSIDAEHLAGGVGGGAMVYDFVTSSSANHIVAANTDYTVPFDTLTHNGLGGVVTNGSWYPPSAVVSNPVCVFAQFKITQVAQAEDIYGWVCDGDDVEIALQRLKDHYCEDVYVQMFVIYTPSAWNDVVDLHIFHTDTDGGNETVVPGSGDAETCMYIWAVQ